MLVVALLAGGGGAAFGLANLGVELFALVILALEPERTFGFFHRAPLYLRALVSLSLILPLIQIVPLPAGLWHGLPGRELVAESLGLVGKADAPFPISVDAGRTFSAFLAMLPPLAILAIGWELDTRDRETLGWTIAVAGIACALFGGIQLITTNSFGILYVGFAEMDKADLYGFLANHNTTAAFLDLVLAILVGLPAHRHGLRGNGSLRIAAAVMLVITVILTRSRSGILLLAVPLALAAWRYGFALLRPERGSRRKLAYVAVALAVAAGIVAVGSLRFEQSFGRFSSVDDNERPQIWEDTITAAKRYWPVGSGIGTFDEVFQVDESLEYVTSRTPGRAHNEYLEVTVESGLAGPLLLTAWLVFFAICGLAALRRGGDWQARGGLAALLLLALQSALDYPLRNETMLCFAATALLILLTARAMPDEETR